MLYAFDFAAFVLITVLAEDSPPLIRRTFPHFYMFVIFTSALGAGLVISADRVSGVIIATTAISSRLARQVLTPASNPDGYQEAKARVKTVHMLSVVVTLAHIASAALVALRLSNG